jgi:hypothetical protein
MVVCFIGGGNRSTRRKSPSTYRDCHLKSEHNDKYKKSLKIPKGGNQNPYIDEEQTTQWPKEKVQKDKQRSTKHTYKTKDRVTRTPLKINFNTTNS